MKQTRMLKTISVLALACAAVLSATQATAGEAEIRKGLESMYPTAKIDKISPTIVKGIFEVVVGQEIVYSDETGRMLFFGNMVDTSTKQNLTEARKEKLQAVNFKDLPFELAIKTVKGDGSRVFASFEDPNCGYCKQLHSGLKTLTNYTLYTFLMPILSEDSKTKTRAIWCSADRAKSLREWMGDGLPPAAQNCDVPIAKMLDIGTRLGVKGTPTLFFADGSRAPGYVPGPQLDQMLFSKSPAESPAPGTRADPSVPNGGTPAAGPKPKV